MRAATALALVGAATSVLATAQVGDVHQPAAVAVAARDSDVGGIFFEMDSAAHPESTTAPELVTTSKPESEHKASWTSVDTTGAVVEPHWDGNATDTPTPHLPTEDPTTTDSEPAEVTGGALPQPMKASAAGLLGFFIMSLVML